jgi:D-threonate/D-erythronate kinase
MLATLIADDLTGACDAGAPFAGRGRVGVFVAPASPGPEWTVAAVDTESRGLPPVDAAEAVRGVVRRLGTRPAGGLLFKKIDSTLRGPIGAELEALLETSGRRAALLCPAFPDQGRTVLNGTLLVSGAPAHENPIGRDPAYPGPTSNVVEIVRRGAARPVSFLPLDHVRGDRDALARTLRDVRHHIIVADSLTDGDLHALAGATLGCTGLALVGSAGLARAAAAAYGFLAPPAALPRGRAWLIVAGSLHPAARAQLGGLEAAGVMGVRLDGAADPDAAPLVAEIKGGRPVFIATSDRMVAGPDARLAARSRLTGFAARILADSRPDLIAVTGGETAAALLRAVGANRLDLSGAPLSGLALGDAVVDSTTRLPLLTKAGGFGPPDLFLALLERTSP